MLKCDFVLLELSELYSVSGLKLLLNNYYTCMDSEFKRPNKVYNEEYHLYPTPQLFPL